MPGDHCAAVRFVGQPGIPVALNGRFADASAQVDHFGSAWPLPGEVTEAINALDSVAADIGERCLESGQVPVRVRDDRYAIGPSPHLAGTTLPAASYAASTNAKVLRLSTALVAAG